MQRAKAFVFASEEDFGLIPVEAKACGTPVIAYGKGGALEKITGLDQGNPTGLFFQEQTVKSLQEAITLFEKNRDTFTLENCIEQAKQFAPEVFYKKYKEFVLEKYSS